MTSSLRRQVTKRPKLSPWQTLWGASSALSGKTLESSVVVWKEHRTGGSRGCILSKEEQVMALLWASAHLSVP